MAMTTLPRKLDAHVPWAELRSERFQWIPCLLCGSVLYAAQASITINWHEFFLVECTHCGFRWRNPLPDAGFLQQLYGESYYNVGTLAPELMFQVGIPDTRPEDRELRRQKSEVGVREWAEWGIVPNTPSGKGRVLLEIGGGSGYLQQAAGAVGWSTLGLEISPHGIKAAIENGLNMLPVTLDEFCGKFIPYRGYFDAVAFFDFLEHVTDPGQTLRMVRYIMKADGDVLLRVPVTADMPSLHLIDHIFYFTRATIRSLLQKEGFVVKDVHESGVFRSPSGDHLENIIIVAKPRGEQHA